MSSPEGVEPEQKRSRLHRNNQSGQAAISHEVRLCASLTHGRVEGQECPYGEGCRFSHDLEAYLAGKPEDLEGECPLVVASGSCRYGVTCCYAKAHPVDMAKGEEAPSSIRVDLNGVRKRTIRFPQTDAFLAALKHHKEGRKDERGKDDVDAPPVDDASQALLVVDEAGSTRYECYPFGKRRRIDFTDKLVLAR